MASIQGAFLEWFRPQVAKGRTARFMGDDTEMPGVDNIALLSVRDPSSDGISVLCSIEVQSASFDAQLQTAVPLRVQTVLNVNFTIEPRVRRQQERRDWLYKFFTDVVHGWAGTMSVRNTAGVSSEEGYSVQGMLLTGYSQGIIEGTEISVEQFGVLVPHATILDRGFQ